MPYLARKSEEKSVVLFALLLPVTKVQIEKC
jgi:hypothetical protein